jgi:hypothetical protein
MADPATVAEVLLIAGRWWSVIPQAELEDAIEHNRRVAERCRKTESKSQDGLSGSRDAPGASPE